MNIVHLTAPAEFGGLERVVDSLVRRRHASGLPVHSVALLGLAQVEPAWHSALADAGVATSVIRTRSRSYLTETRAIRDTLRKLDADIVHSHGYRADALGFFAARGTRASTVSTVHGFTRGAGMNAVYESIQRRVLRRFDRVVVVSSPLAAELAASGVRTERLATIPNVICLDESQLLGRHEARLALGLSSDDIVIGWVGRLSHEKGPDIAIEALHEVSAANIQLAFIGEGPMSGGLRQQISAAGLDSRVHLLGAKAHAARYLRAFDVLMMSSRTEGTPVIALEAAQASVPIVATAVGGIPDIVGDDAWLSTTDPKALAVRVRAALDDQAGRVAKAVRLRQRIVNTNDAAAWCERYDAVYEATATRR